MKILLTLLSLFTIIDSYSGELDGRTYCRTMQVDDENFEHCVAFLEGTISNNRYSYNGNAPIVSKYYVSGADGTWIMVEQTPDSNNYEIEFIIEDFEEKEISHYEEGYILKLKK